MSAAMDVVKNDSKNSVEVNANNPEKKISTEFAAINSMASLDVLSEFSNFPVRKKKKKKVHFVSNDELQQKMQSPVTFCDSKSRMETSFCDTKDTSEITSDSTKANYLDTNFDFSKKKKKPKHLRIAHEDLEEIQMSENKTHILDKLSTSTDSDYTYEYLLSRFYSIAKLERPNVDMNSTMKIVLKPPQKLTVLFDMENIIETKRCESPIDFTNIKKKKKPINLGNTEISKNEKESSCAAEVAVPKLNEDSSDLESEIDFCFGKKKRKKKLPFPLERKTSTEKECSTVPCLLEDLSLSEECVADNSDYSYDYLLSRAFGLMREKNPDMDECSKKKLVMKPPQVLRAGTKRTSLANFLEICKILRRTPQHVQSFLLVELGTNGSIDGNGQLVVKGKFQQKQMESVLRRYIREYVTCHTCHSADTVLLKETRLCFLQCEACGSRCSVANIKSGFQAVISKRAAMRAKVN